MAIIEIDKASGFCFGVTTAIRKAEEELNRSGHLYCLGDIVHNSNEVERLESNGLVTITHDQLRCLRGVNVLLRAHGEPPRPMRWHGATTFTSSMPLARWFSSSSSASMQVSTRH